MLVFRSIYTWLYVRRSLGSDSLSVVLSVAVQSVAASRRLPLGLAGTVIVQQGF